MLRHERERAPKLFFACDGISGGDPANAKVQDTFDFVRIPVRAPPPKGSLSHPQVPAPASAAPWPTPNRVRQSSGPTATAASIRRFGLLDGTRCPGTPSPDACRQTEVAFPFSVASSQRGERLARPARHARQRPALGEEQVRIGRRRLQRALDQRERFCMASGIVEACSFVGNNPAASPFAPPFPPPRRNGRAGRQGLLMAHQSRSARGSRSSNQIAQQRHAVVIRFGSEDPRVVLCRHAGPRWLDQPRG